ncbi:GATA-type zinc finger protein 1 [Theristicus caerulescens]
MDPWATGCSVRLSGCTPGPWAAPSVCQDAPLDHRLLCPSVWMLLWAPLDLGLHCPFVRMHPWAALSIRMHLHAPLEPGDPRRGWGCSPPAEPPGAGSSSEDDAPLAQGSKRCASCKTRRTPLWRAAENGTPLCNACGIRYKKYRVRCRRCWNIPGKSGTPRPQCPHCGERCHPAGGGKR